MTHRVVVAFALAVGAAPANGADPSLRATLHATADSLGRVTLSLGGSTTSSSAGSAAQS